MFKKLENNRPFLKMALKGFGGSGKSYTSAIVAVGLHKIINSKKPIAIYDTEKAFKALPDYFNDAGIEAIINDESRSLASLREDMKLCEDGAADILIIDSLTHVYEEFIRAYLNRPDKYGKPVQRTRLEMLDYTVIKPAWKEQFSTPFIQANVHIIFTGRAGFTYSNEINEETGKREIFQTGIKMKADGEIEYEPDLLVLMERYEEVLGRDKKVWREGTIIKDRTTKTDGQTFVNPTFENFYPAIKILLNGTLRQLHGVDIPDTFADFENKYGEQARERDRLIAEIEASFQLMGLSSQAAKDKQVKAWTLNQVYGVNSLESVGKKNLQLVKDGLKTIKTFADKYKAYIDDCLRNEQPTDGNKVQQLMKELLTVDKQPAS